MKLEIKSCEECPFNSRVGVCNHPNGDVVPADVPPEKCPLRLEVLVLTVGDSQQPGWARYRNAINYPYGVVDEEDKRKGKG